MTTLAQWIAETRDHLDGNRSEEANQLASAYTAGSGTITLKEALGNIGPGSLISVGLNTLRVTAVNSLTKQATVIAGQGGSTDTAASINDMVRVNPRFTDHQIVREINRHLASLSSPKNGVFRVATVNVAYTSSRLRYGLTATGLIKVLAVRRETFGADYSWPTVRPDMWDVDRNANTTDFPTGISIRIDQGSTGLNAQVVYAAAFTPIALVLSTDVSTTGITTEQEDIPPLGAAVRLMTGREVSRNSPQSQGDSRRSDEVGPGAVAASYRGLAQLWQLRVREEAARLAAMYPVSKA